MSTILIIDDDLELAKSMVDILSFEGHQVLTANRGDEGLAMARQHPPDLILCDVTMPGLRGFNVYRLLQEDSATAHIPFIFVTGIIPEELPSGTCSLTKPFRIQELLDVVQKMLA